MKTMDLHYDDDDDDEVVSEAAHWSRRKYYEWKDNMNEFMIEAIIFQNNFRVCHQHNNIHTWWRR